MNIYQKLIEVRKSVPYLKKDNQGHQYNYVSSSQVLSSIRQKMDEVGLLLVPQVISKEVTQDMVESKDKYGNTKHTTTYFTELNMEFTWVNVDDPSETIVCLWYGQGVDVAGEKGVGKALTYAEKYFLLKFFNIATDKDDPDAFQHKTEDKPKDIPGFHVSPSPNAKATKAVLAKLAEKLDDEVTKEILTEASMTLYNKQKSTDLTNGEVYGLMDWIDAYKNLLATARELNIPEEDVKTYAEKYEVEHLYHLDKLQLLETTKAIKGEK